MKNKCSTKIKMQNIESVLHILKKYYLSLKLRKEILGRLIHNSPLSLLSPSMQERILDVTINDAIAVKYPAPLSFKKKFLRWILDEVEISNEESTDSLLIAYTDIMKISDSSNEYFYCSYIFGDKVITIKEISAIGTLGTTGLRTWEAAIYLAEWSIENASKFKNRTVLELGAGMGLLGCVILSFSKPKCYMFTDKSLHVLELLKENIDVNKSSFMSVEEENFNVNHCYKISHLTCNEDFSILEFSDIPDIIIASDIIFDPSDIPGFVRVIKMFLDHGTQVAYIACTIRNKETNKRFEAELELANLKNQVEENQSASVYCTPETHFKLYIICKS